MKATLVIFLIGILLGWCGCTKSSPDITGNENRIDTFILNNYTNDVLELYVREIYSDSTHKNYNDPVLDSTETNKILRIIQAVYASQSPQRDTVFTIRKIHTYFCTLSKWVVLGVNPNAPEIQKLASLIIPTGNTDLDKILNTYQFDKVDSAYGYPGFPFLSLRTPRFYNLQPAKKQFQKIPSIRSVEINSCVGDGSNIFLIRNNDSARIRFSYGSGDCPSGCTFRRTWEFKVVNNKAEFVKVTEP